MSEWLMSYMKKRAAVIDTAILEYLNDKTSERYLMRLLGRSGYKYDAEAVLKSVILPANYLLGLGGKRWRSILMLEVVEALGKNPDNYIEFSIIPEMVHNGTLIHDDVEDNSEMRRGAPAVHRKFSIDVALNLGDFMYYFPMVALLETKKLTERSRMKMIAIYHKNMLKVSLGQAIDIAWHGQLVDLNRISEEEYLQMAYMKTGALSCMAAQLGAVIGGADDPLIAALGNFGASLGVAFQLEDDLLNITQSKLSEGKGGVGEDIKEGKVSLLVIHALQHARPNDKKRLINVLSEHTSDAKKIENAITVIEGSGAPDYIRSLKERLLNAAWRGIDKKLPDSEAKRRMRALSQFLINRSI